MPRRARTSATPPIQCSQWCPGPACLHFPAIMPASTRVRLLTTVPLPSLARSSRSRRRSTMGSSSPWTYGPHPASLARPSRWRWTSPAKKDCSGQKDGGDTPKAGNKPLSGQMASKSKIPGPAGLPFPAVGPASTRVGLLTPVPLLPLAGLSRSGRRSTMRRLSATPSTTPPTLSPAGGGVQGGLHGQSANPTVSASNWPLLEVMASVL